MISGLEQLNYQELKEAHLSRILEIEKLSNSAPWSERSFRNELENGQSIFLAAFLRAKLVAFGGVWLCIDEAHITTVAVDPENRRQGIGRALMKELLRRAKEAGMTCSTLEVRAGNRAAIDLYLSLGYVETATRKKYYPDNREDAVVMWLHDLGGF